jgi:uncharacterized protein YndB with AHSA1/START domain
MTNSEYRTEIRIDATPDDVFPYLIDASLLVRWMGDWADFDPVNGGRYIVDINGVPIRGHFLDIDPPHRVVFSWGAAGSDQLPPDSTTVEITLQPDGDGTILQLIHSKLPDDQQAQHGIGWTHFLERLAAAASGHDPGADPWSADRV